MQQIRDVLCLKAVLVLPGANPVDHSNIADPVRIPVRIIWRQSTDQSSADIAST